ncbi:hypothetical protein TNCV_3100151 [Trichonephila clavipes]|nr:hypothetical protein TNCV_3100151 [Trichonephila clavipes]
MWSVRAPHGHAHQAPPFPPNWDVPPFPLVPALRRPFAPVGHAEIVSYEHYTPLPTSPSCLDYLKFSSMSAESPIAHRTREPALMKKLPSLGVQDLRSAPPSMEDLWAHLRDRSPQ